MGRSEIAIASEPTGCAAGNCVTGRLCRRQLNGRQFRRLPFAERDRAFGG